MTSTEMIRQAKFWGDIAWRMLRVRTVFMMVLFQAIGYESVRAVQQPPWRFYVAMAMLGLLYMCATCFNDASDVEIDKENLAHDTSRPLVKSSVTAKQLQALGVLALLLAAACALVVEPRYLILFSAGVLLNVCYSLPPLRISHRGFMAILWLPISYVGVSFFAGAWLHHQIWPHQAWWILAGLYVSFIGRIILKDFRDVKGDRKYGKRTFLVRHGPRLTCWVAASAWLAGDAILSAVWWHESPIFVLSMQLVIVLIWEGLWQLAKERKLALQIQWVMYIGRLGNAVALGLLTILSLRAVELSKTLGLALLLSVLVCMVVVAMNLRNNKPLTKMLEAKFPG